MTSGHICIREKKLNNKKMKVIYFQQNLIFCRMVSKNRASKSYWLTSRTGIIFGFKNHPGSYYEICRKSSKIFKKIDFFRFDFACTVILVSKITRVSCIHSTKYNIIYTIYLYIIYNYIYIYIDTINLYIILLTYTI